MVSQEVPSKLSVITQDFSTKDLAIRDLVGKILPSKTNTAGQNMVSQGKLSRIDVTIQDMIHLEPLVRSTFIVRPSPTNHPLVVQGELKFLLSYSMSFTIMLDQELDLAKGTFSYLNQ